MSSAPAPQFDPVEPADNSLLVAASEPVVAAEPPVAEPQDSEPASAVRPYEYIGVIHLTRTWVQYGIFGFAVLCIIIGAVEALFGQ